MSQSTMSQKDLEALKRDFDYNVEKADQEGAFWTRLFAMSVNVFIRRFMGRRHFDRAILMVMSVLMVIIMLASNSLIHTVSKGLYSDYPMTFFVIGWFIFAVRRKLETRKLIEVEGIKLHSKYRGLPFGFWQKIPFLAPHIWEAVAIALLGFLWSFYPYTNLDLLLYGAAIGKFLFETVDRTARREAEQDEQDARLANSHEYYQEEREADRTTEYQGSSSRVNLEGYEAIKSAPKPIDKEAALKQKKKDAFNLEGAEFDFNKVKNQKDDD